MSADDRDGAPDAESLRRQTERDLAIGRQGLQRLLEARGAAAMRAAFGAYAADDPIEPAAVRRPSGRPPWSARLFRTRWSAAVVRGELPETATLEAVAPYFEMLDGTLGIDAEYLRRLQRKHGRD